MSIARNTFIFYKLNCIILLLIFTKGYAQPDTDSVYVIHKIVVEGNKKTKEKIILRELTFKEGDSIPAADLSIHTVTSKNNLNNTSLFNYIHIDTVLNYPEIECIIKVEERWYTWPYLILDHADRNFNAWIESERPLERIIWGLYLRQENFRGRKELLKFKFVFGYREHYAIKYEIPFIDKKQQQGVSVSFSYYQQHETHYEVRDNELQYYKSPDKYLLNYFTLNATYTLRKYLFAEHWFTIGTVNASALDTLVRLNENYFGNSQRSLDYFYMEYDFHYERRDYKIYPLKGYYIGIKLRKSGLGIYRNSMNNGYLQTSLRNHFQLAKRWYYGMGITTKINFSKDKPYFRKKPLGFDDYLRGYEHYVIEGHNYIVSRNSLKFCVLPKTILHLKFIPFSKFNKIHFSMYMNANFDAGYAESYRMLNNNYMSNELLYGTGLGLDIVTYYDQLMRIEYSCNKQGEAGFYIHFEAPI